MENGSNKVKISVKELTEVCIKAVSTLGYTSDETGMKSLDVSVLSRTTWFDIQSFDSLTG